MVETWWDTIKRYDSSNINVSKFTFEKSDAIAEAVLYKYPDYATRTVICCSTQSGCPVGCRFCGAGDSFVRSLTWQEIIEQPDYLLRVAGFNRDNAHSIGRLQIMFMSMGEPLLNFKELSKAISYLAEAYPKAKLLISTSAPQVDYEPVRQLSKQWGNVGLQFSVHKTTDEERDKLIPFRAKLNLKEIAEQGLAWAHATGRKPYFNYVVDDTNNKEVDAERLNSLFDPSVWEATLSVVCERNDGLPATNDYQRQLASDFSQKLLSRGFSTRVFDPAGQDDIGGGCGQLPHAQKWFKQHEDKTKKTVGYGLPMVHTPRAI